MCCLYLSDPCLHAGLQNRSRASSLHAHPVTRRRRVGSRELSCLSWHLRAPRVQVLGSVVGDRYETLTISVEKQWTLSALHKCRRLSAPRGRERTEICSLDSSQALSPMAVARSAATKALKSALKQQSKNVRQYSALAAVAAPKVAAQRAAAPALVSLSKHSPARSCTTLTCRDDDRPAA